MTEHNFPQIKRLQKYTLIIGALFTLIAALSYFYNLNNEKKEIVEYALGMAKVSFEKDLLYRVWASKHGGVYVPITEETQPNKYLTNVEEKNIETPSGKKLTLVNPAYMTRQVHEIADERYKVKGHITSLNPINPINAADEWENNVLEKFDEGIVEYSSVEIINGKEYLRYMKHMVTEESCLKCHAHQGYKLGEIRGGISVSVPLEDYIGLNKGHLFNLKTVHITGWLLFMAFGFISYKRISKNMYEKNLAEITLKKNYDKYKTILNTTNDGFWISDKDGNLLEVNDIYCEMIGYTKEELLSMKISDLDFYDNEDDVYKRFQILKQTKYILFETVHKKKDSTKLNVEISASYLTIENEELYVVFIRNISERINLNEELKTREQFLLQTQKIAKLGNYSLNVAKGTWKSSEVLDQLFGIDSSYPKDIGSWLKIVYEEDQEMMQDYFTNNVLVNREDFNKQYRIKRINDGEIRWVNGKGKLSYNGNNEIQSMIGTISDITEKYLSEEELEKHRNHLEELVEQRTKELLELNFKLGIEVENRKKAESLVQSALKKEKELHKLKTDFISMTSHEFRTPLTSILAAADLIDMFGSKMPEDKIKKHVKNIQNSVNDMNLLMEDVLTVSRIERGKITNEPVEINLSEFCETLIDLYNLQLKPGQKINLLISKDLKYTIDPKLLKNILSNLLSNSIKYSPEESEITIHVLENENELIIKVIDQGLGIPESEIENIFDQFKRSSKTTNIQGTGLGLYIVKTSLDLINGKIEVTSEEDKGSTFIIKLPRKNKAT